MMKKLALSTMTALFALSNVAMAEEKTAPAEPAKAAQAVAVLQVFDVSAKEAKLLEGNRLSRTKAREVCLVLANVNWQEQNLFAFAIKSPKAVDLTRLVQQGEVRVSQDKKEMLVVTQLPKNVIPANNVFPQCWKMEKTDPLGTYEIEVQVNGMVFKGLKFEVLK